MSLIHDSAADEEVPLYYEDEIDGVRSVQKDTARLKCFHNSDTTVITITPQISQISRHSNVTCSEDEEDVRMDHDFAFAPHYYLSPGSSRLEYTGLPRVLTQEDYRERGIEKDSGVFSPKDGIVYTIDMALSAAAGVEEHTLLQEWIEKRGFEAQKRLEDQGQLGEGAFVFQGIQVEELTGETTKKKGESYIQYSDGSSVTAVSGAELLSFKYGWVVGAQNVLADDHTAE